MTRILSTELLERPLKLRFRDEWRTKGKDAILQSRMALPEEDIKRLRDELDRLYKNWVVITGRASRFIEKLRRGALPRDEADAAFWNAYGHWKDAGRNDFGDCIAKAVNALDPRWSKTWANYRALLVLEPNGHHNPPVLWASEKDNPPSNMIEGEKVQFLEGDVRQK